MAISAYLTALGDDDLVDLLRRRPDLANPSPVTLTSLAARATSRASLERALAGVDAAVLQAVEAVVALTPDGPPTRDRVIAAVAGPGSRSADAARRPRSSNAPGAPAAADAALVGRALDEAIALALVWPELPPPGAAAPAGPVLRAAPGLADLFGPYPAGLAPSAPAPEGGDRGAAGGHGAAAGATTGEQPTRPPAAALRPDEDPVRRGPAELGADERAVPPALAQLGPDERAVPPALTQLGPDERAVPPALTQLGPDERAVLDALTWGPPVGLVPPPGSPAVAAVARLVDAGLLVPSGPRQVVLPRGVALALRQGRTHREPARPPAPRLPRRPDRVVAAESAAAAERVVRLVVRLLGAWGEAPPAVLRAGGLGVRDLRRTAASLEVEEAEAAFVVELAGTAGLVADDGEERPAFAPTDDVDAWLRGDLPSRWERLAGAWLTSERAAWLVGTRGDRGTPHAALEPDLHRRWVPRVRGAVLDVLGAVAPGEAPALDDVLAALRWRTPRSAPPTGAVQALLAEAALLGVLGAGALAPAGRALRTSPAAAAAALAESLPEPVDEVLLQGDLTGIVPGRPSDRLAALLERVARVESRGGALTVRFTPETVRAALDAGATADELLAGLASVARGGVPQPLEYLVRDAARRHGALRAGVASSYLRADDPALLAGLPDDPRLAGLGLRLLAPTVLVAAVSPVDLVAALHERGLAPVVEGPDGVVVHVPAVARRVRVRPRRAEPVPDEGARLRGLVGRLRRAEDSPVADAAGAPPAVATNGDVRRAPTPAVQMQAHRRIGSAPQAAPGAGTAGPAAALVVLREAAADRALAWVEIVGGRGVLERRLLRPVSVDGGRLRAVDPAREAELVVAVHRIAGAERAS